MLAFAVLAGTLRRDLPDPVAVRALLDSADHAAAAESTARRPSPDAAACWWSASGIDYAAARELALKIEEGARLPASRSSSRRSATATWAPPTRTPAWSWSSPMARAGARP